MRTTKTNNTTSLYGVELLPEVFFDLIDKSFENGCIDGFHDCRWNRTTRPVPNVDGIRINYKQKEALRAYKLGYMMTREIFLF